MKKISKKELKQLKAQISLLKRNLKKSKRKYQKLTGKHVASGGKPKGGAYEHKIAGIIIKHFGKLGFTEADCYRTKNSGGGKQPGDLQCSSALAKHLPFCFECKHYKGGRLLYHLLYRFEDMQKSWPFRSWWEQLEAEVKESKKPGLLIWRENNGEDMVSFYQGALLLCTKLCGHSLGQKMFALPHLQHCAKSGEVIWTMKLKDFLRTLVHHARRKNEKHK